MKQIIWTIRTAANEKGMSQAMGSFPTKREAVKFVMAHRMDKTPIVRDGHSYVYTSPKN